MPDLAWYTNRLRIMSPQEIGFRIYRKTRDGIERFQWYQKWKVGQIVKDNTSKNSLIDRLRGLFPFQLFKDSLSQNSGSGAFLQGKQNIAVSPFPIFEDSIDPSFSGTDWHMDPKTGKRWPLIYCGSIDIRDAKDVGEVDYVWRLNRCQHLIQLAQTSFLQGDNWPKHLALNQILSWIKHNPYLIGVNWTSSMEAAIRCISWIIVLAYICQDDELSEEELTEISQSLRLQTDYVYSHLSLFSSANNHLIVELTGLVTVGLLFSESQDGKKWLQRGMTGLAREIERQVYTDGVGKEQSVHYHGLVLDCLLWLIVLSQRAGLEMPKIITSRAEEMCAFIMAIMDHGGHLPAIGDSDDGYVIWLSDMSKLDTYCSQLATCAVLFNRPDFKIKAKTFDEKSFWLLGAKGDTAFAQIDATLAPAESQAFQDGGYYVMKSGQAEEERLLIFDCGPLGYSSTAAHGHADALSICLSIGGSPTLIDPGTYTYLCFPEWREYFRSTVAHNTAAINDSSQSQPGGPYIWIQHAKIRCDVWYVSKSFDYVAGSHDGYLKRYGMTHRRGILFVKPDYFLVEDCFDGNEAFDAQTFFHFGQGEACIYRRNTNYLCEYHDQLQGANLQIIVPCRNELKVDIVKGNESPTQGWQSPRYGNKNPNDVLITSLRTTGKYRLPCLLVPDLTKLPNDFGTNKLVCWQLNDDRRAGYERVSLEFKEYRDDIFIIYDPDLILRIGAIEVAAEIVFVRSRIDGTIACVFSVNTTGFKIGVAKHYNYLKNGIIDLKLDKGKPSILNGEAVGSINHSDKKHYRKDLELFLRIGKHNI